MRYFLKNILGSNDKLQEDVQVNFTFDVQQTYLIRFVHLIR